MLNAHIDTVGLAGMEAPLEPRVEDGRLYGRGAYDMKASLAAILVAARDAAATGLRGDVVVTAVADEEFASRRHRRRSSRARRADAAIVAEPTELGVAVAHRGFVAWELETTGRAAHGSRPDLGVDAIAHMGHVLVELDDLDRDSARRLAAIRCVGTGSLHAGTIEGGAEFSTYPATLPRARRAADDPGRDARARRAPSWTRRSSAAPSRSRTSTADVRVPLAREPFEVPEDEEIVELVKRQSGGDERRRRARSGRTPRSSQAAGIPTVVFGPAGEGAHADVEWVDLESVERCAKALVAVAREFCA